MSKVIRPLKDFEQDRFWQRVDIKGDNDCWLWLGTVNTTSPYGKICIAGTCWFAHRLAYFLTNKIVVKVVRHTCDNTLCCNPKHLIGGTQLDNITDSIQRGRFHKVDRANYGEKNGRASITWDTVELLRLHKQVFDLPCTVMEMIFNISDHTIRCVINYQTWIRT